MLSDMLWYRLAVLFLSIYDSPFVAAVGASSTERTGLLALETKVLNVQEITSIKNSIQTDMEYKKDFVLLPSSIAMCGWKKSASTKLCSTFATAPQRNVRSAMVQSRVLSQTSKAHKDRYWSPSNPNVVGEDVGFFFLNSNPNAAFIYLQDGHEQEVSVQAGDWVQFRGDVSHYTRIEEGVVELAGPWLLSSWEPVGGDNGPKCTDLNPPNCADNGTPVGYCFVSQSGTCVADCEMISGAFAVTCSNQENCDYDANQEACLTISAAPSRKPSSAPSRSPSSRPSSRPNPLSSSTPSSIPSASSRPSRKPSSRPASTQSQKPSSKPSSRPASSQSQKPSSKPSSRPASSQSQKPSSKPSSMPSPPTIPLWKKKIGILFVIALFPLVAALFIGGTIAFGTMCHDHNDDHHDDSSYHGGSSG